MHDATLYNQLKAKAHYSVTKYNIALLELTSLSVYSNIYTRNKLNIKSKLRVSEMTRNSGLNKTNAKTSAIYSSSKKMNYKVSVLVPCCNVEKYVSQCMDSIIAQTLNDLEIICINDGSKDSTLKILQSYAKKDPRIKIIDKPNSGYGDSMNKGLAIASGEYIGIVESDDFIEPNMYEELYNTARTFDAEVVKANFWLYWSNPLKNELHEFFKQEECGFILNPRIHNNASIFGRKPSIWSAIYKNSFLKKNKINFLTTPGASFQDTSFTFKVYAACEKMVCLYQPFLHYRQDNENSSVNNADKKAYFVCQEYEEIEKYITERKEVELYPVYGAMFYDACIWMYERLGVQMKYKFLQKVSPLLKTVINKVGLNNLNFGDAWWKRRDIVRIANDPFEYHMWRNVERYEQIGDTFTYKTVTTPVGNIKDCLKNKKRKSKNDIPFFSIIVPVYNNEKYLRSCLDSILFQSEHDFEAICVNDGSSDHSLAILEEYANYDKSFIVINQLNSGPSEARNAGLKVASGKFILFLDSDDYFSENTCKILKEVILSETKQIDAVLFGTRLFPDVPKASNWHYKVLTTDNRYFENITQEQFLTVPYLNVYSWRYCFKYQFIKDHNLYFDQSYKYGEDAIFVMSALTKMQGLKVISDQLYNYRHYREGSLMNEINKDYVSYTKIQLNILKKLLSIATNNGFVPSKSLLEYSCDFIYGCITSCPEPQRTHYITDFVNIVQKYGLDVYAWEASENCRGFWEYCVNIKKINRKSYNFKKSIRSFGAKIIWPSRRVFYDNIKQLHERIQMEQDTVNFLQQQLSDLQGRFCKQEELLIEMLSKLKEINRD